MLITDTLVVIGLATASLGTIQETGGVQEHTYWLRNDGTEAVTLQQGYTSCECTTIEFDRYAQVQPGDSSSVTLRFNPQGRGGEFNVTGTVVYGSERKRVKLAMTGNSILSEETLMKRFPVAVSDNLRLSVDRFDLGIMHPGETKERSVVVLHRDENDRITAITLGQEFLEYGLWQDYGTGKEVARGNSGDIGRDKVRQRRRWFSRKFYASFMNLKEFMADSIGREFIGMVSDALDADKMRRNSHYYQTH